jgi:phosphoserine phosphatase RsbU/P
MQQSPTVLIIDDLATNRMILKGIFAKEGFEVLEAASGPEGRELALEYLPDLILLDIMMPVEDGFETCEVLKLDHRTAEIPVIFVSALADPNEKVRGFEIGAVDYITKPFHRAEVMARARLHMRLNKAHTVAVEEQNARLGRLREAQQAILVRPEECEAAGFAVSYRPVHETGGDFYDVVETSDDVFGYFVADISGHDLKASFSTPALKALIRQNAKSLFKPDETMKLLNRSMCSSMPEGQFLTACYAYLDRFRSKLTVVNAGHPPIVYLNRAGETETIGEPGDVMGVFPSVLLGVTERSVEVGERFFLYTDGLIERFGPKKKVWADGLMVLSGACRATREMPLEDAVEAIVNVLCEGDPPEDDLVLLGVEV